MIESSQKKSSLCKIFPKINWMELQRLGYDKQSYFKYKDAFHINKLLLMFF